MTSLEGWGSTIELRPHNLPASVARLRAPAHQAGRHRQRTGSAPLPAPRAAPAGRMIIGSNLRSAAPASRKGGRRRPDGRHVPHTGPGFGPLVASRPVS
jgi:hypothetical protein